MQESLKEKVYLLLPTDLNHLEFDSLTRLTKVQKILEFRGTLFSKFATEFGK